MSRAQTAREAEAVVRAERRLRRQRDMLRPLSVLVIAALAIGAINGHPSPATKGTGLGVAVALVVFAVAFVVSARDGFITKPVSVQAGVIGAMSAAGIALIALQPQGAIAIAGGAAVWMSVTRLPLRLGVSLGAATTAGLGLAEALAGSSAAAVAATVLLCSLLGLVAYVVKQARASQDTTELLLAQLEDARDRQLATAAIAERSRIAGELHDVLAHSLSGAALQLQGARKLAERQNASPQLWTAIDRAGELVRDGLANARQAVGALRGDGLPGVGELEALVAAFKDDLGSDVTLTIEGSPRPLPTEASLALYRGAQEALTNVGRYAPGAATSVVLRYEARRTTLEVEDFLARPDPAAEGLEGVGGGHGLDGLRERLEHAGGTLRAGPTDTGWRVQLDVPA